MSIHSGLIPYDQIKFQHGFPLPGTAFEQWAFQEVCPGSEERYPRDVLFDFNHLENTGTFRRLSLYGHNPLELSIVVQTIVRRRGRKLLRSQQEGILQFKELKAQLLGMPSQELEDKRLMDLFFKAFDNVFFNGALRGLCKIRFDPQESMTLRGKCVSPYKSLEKRRKIPDNYACLIILIRLDKDRRFQDRKERISKYLGTLAHESLHSFFLAYIPVTDYVVLQEQSARKDGRNLLDPKDIRKSGNWQLLRSRKLRCSCWTKSLIFIDGIASKRKGLTIQIPLIKRNYKIGVSLMTYKVLV